MLRRAGWGLPAPEGAAQEPDALELWSGQGDPRGCLVSQVYLPLRRLGGGCFGEVHLAFDLSAERYVALKSIRRDRLRDRLPVERLELMHLFEREARNLLHLPCVPQLLRLFAVTRHRGVVYLVLESLGEDGPRPMDHNGPAGRLTDHLGKAGSFALSWMRDICTGLAVLHRAGITHGDVKPANVLLRDGGRHAALIDFGFSQVIGRLEVAAYYMTPLYAAPELLDDEAGPPSVRTDIFAFGVTVIELITGEVKRDKDRGLVFDRERCARWSMGELIDACTAPQPGDRPASFDEILAVLQRVLEADGYPPLDTLMGSLWPTPIAPERPADRISRAGALADFEPQIAVTLASEAAAESGAEPQQQALALLVAARAHLRLGQWEESFAAAQRALSLSARGGRESFLAHVAMAEALSGLGRTVEGLAECDLAAQIEPGIWKDQYQLLAARGRLLLRAGHVTEVEKMALQARLTHPLSPDLEGELAIYWITRGELERSLPYARRWLEAAPTEVMANVTVAMGLAPDEPMEALEYVLRVARRDWINEIHPDLRKLIDEFVGMLTMGVLAQMTAPSRKERLSTVRLIELCNLLYEAGFYESALFYLGTVVISGDAHDGRVLALKAQILRRRPDLDNPHLRANTLIALAHADEQAGRFDEALSNYDAALAERIPAQAVAVIWFNKGNVLVAAGHGDEAEDAYLRSLRASPPNAIVEGILNKLLAVLESPDRLHEALVCAERAIIILPRSAVLWAHLARTLYYLDRYFDAAIAAKRCIELDASIQIAAQIQAMACAEVLRMEAMLKRAETEAAASPSAIGGWHLKMVALLNLGRVDEAFEVRAQALKMDATWHTIYAMCAAGWLARGNWERAIHECDHALSLAPNDPTAQFLKRAALRARSFEEKLSPS